jgi:hypothetical protein
VRNLEGEGRKSERRIGECWEKEKWGNTMKKKEGGQSKQEERKIRRGENEEEGGREMKEKGVGRRG